MSTTTAGGIGEDGTGKRKLPVFTPQEIDQIAKFIVGNQGRERENVIIPRSFTPTIIKSKEEKAVEAMFESCPFKAVLSLLAGEIGRHSIRASSIFLIQLEE